MYINYYPPEPTIGRIPFAGAIIARRNKERVVKRRAKRIAIARIKRKLFLVA